MRKIIAISGLLVLVVVYGCGPNLEDHLIIATAANAQFAIHEIAESFESETGTECIVVVGSSGKLAAQIREGGPFHCFVSADMKYPEQLSIEGLTIGGVKTYGLGKLVLFTKLDNLDPDLSILNDPRINHIALANPELAPYGEAALQALYSKFPKGKLDSKFVYGESLAQVSQFLLSGSAEIGFISKSLALSPGMKGKGNWKEVDPSTYTEIVQGAVILKNAGEKKSQAEKFMEYLLSPAGVEILTANGYKAHLDQ